MRDLPESAKSRNRGHTNVGISPARTPRSTAARKPAAKTGNAIPDHAASPPKRGHASRTAHTTAAHPAEFPDPPENTISQELPHCFSGPGRPEIRSRRKAQNSSEMALSTQNRFAKSHSELWVLVPSEEL